MFRRCFHKKRRSILILLSVCTVCYLMVDDTNVISKTQELTKKEVANGNVKSIDSKILEHQYTVKYTVKPAPHPCDTLNCVIVVGYFRGGTTMTLDVLSSSDNKFYLFEPIAFLSEDSYRHLPIKFLNGSSRVYSSIELPKVQTQMLSNWFTCAFEQINLSDLKSSHLHFHSKSTRPFFSCQHRHKGNVSSCIVQLKQECLSKHNRIIKVVRMRMASISLLLNKIRNIKIIYLVRDPRAIIQSHLASKLTGRKELIEKTLEICKYMEHDAADTRTLKEKYRNNIFMLKYEALTADPKKTFKQIFKFANLTFSPNVERFINTSLLGNRVSKQNSFLTKSGSAFKIGNNWRNFMKGEDLGAVDKHCGAVYKILGYKSVDQKRLRNMEVSLQVEPLAKDIIDIY